MRKLKKEVTRNSIKITFPYGRKSLLVEVNSDNLLGVLKPGKIKRNKYEDREIEETDELLQALENPIGASLLSEIVPAEGRVAIIVSDITRPLPLKIILPLILEQIAASGCKTEQIKIVFALGNHRMQTSEEKEYILGKKIYQDYYSEDFNAEDTVYVGKTSQGTPIWLSRTVYEADFKICIGNIEMHYFAGYTGGMKAILPGVCNKETITYNHRLMKNKEAIMGSLIDNPVRKDIEEAGTMVGVDFIVNVILDENHKIVKAVAGHPILAHREGCSYAKKIYLVDIKEKADIVIASAGGFPKDMNLYQAQKAMENARKALKSNGTIILLAECKDGPGEGVFQQWMINASTLNEITKRFAHDFELGGHKAGVIANILEKHDIYLISEMNRETTENYFFQFATSVDEAINIITKRIGFEPKIIAMPYAHLTCPQFKKSVKL